MAFHWDQLILSILSGLAFLGLFLLINHLRKKPVNDPFLKTELQRQASHFRTLQLASFWSVNVFFMAGLGAVGLLIILLPPEKYEKIRELVGMVIGAIMMEWKNANQYSFGTSAGSAKSNDAMRETLRVNQVDEKKGE